MKKEEDFNSFKKRVLHPKEELLAILFINPISVRIAYLIKKFNLNISPNQITSIRSFLLFPFTILLLFLAPIFHNKFFYLFVAISAYFMGFTDDLDGNVARGSKKTSNYGAFLDAISDRTYTIIFIVFIISLGIFSDNIILLYGGIFILILKMFHLIIISKIFYYAPKKLNMESIFSAKKETKYLSGIGKRNVIMVNMNKKLKIKRWCESFGGFERFFITFMLPSFLFYLGFELVVFAEMYILTFLFSIFYILRIKNILNYYKNEVK